MKWCGIGVLFVLSFRCWAVEPYVIEVTASIEEEWRWTELEELADLRYVFAKEGLDGVVWFAGRSEVGLYDGVKLERFKLDDPSPIWDCLVSDDGEFYILTWERLCVLRDGEWVVLMDESSIPFGKYQMCKSDDGSILVGVEGGIYKLKDGAFTYYRNDPINIGSMLMDHNGRLWVTSIEGQEILVYDFIDDSEGKLNLAHRFDLPESNPVSPLFLDPSGRVWVLNSDESGNCYFYEDYEKHLGASGLFGPFQEALRTGSLYAFRMATTPSGRYWFSVRRALAELEGKSIRRFEDANFLPTGTPTILALSNERLLIGGIESKTYLVDLSLDRWAMYPGLNYQCEDAEGVSWFLEHEGRLVSSTSDGSRSFMYAVSDGIVENPNRVFCSSDGTLWVSGRHGDSAAVSYRTDNGWKRMEFPDIGEIFSHLSVIEARDGSVVFGSGTPEVNLGDRSGGAVAFRKENGVWVAKRMVPPAYPLRPAIIVERGNDETWYGGSTLFQRRGNAEQLPEEIEVFETSRWTDDLLVDSNRDLWVAAWGKGILQFDGSGWISHTEETGLSSDQVINIFAGKYWSGVWAATAEGLSRYDGRVWSSWDLPFGEPLVREGVVLNESRDGSLWVNKAYRSWFLEGVRKEPFRSMYKTLRYRKNDYAPETRIAAFQNEIPEGSPIVPQWIGQDRWYETPSSELEFSWRLGGGEWSGFSRDTTTVLSGVRSGVRILEVRARDGDWNVDATPAAIEIYIVPPLWKRAWFILLVISTIGLIVFLIDRLFRGRVRAAIALEEFKLDFFTNISHELSNPLAVIVGPLESSLGYQVPSAVRLRLEMALRNARKMQGLVGQLLQFRKMELGKSRFRPTSGELIGFLREAIELHSPLWRKKGVALTVDSSQPYCVCGYDSDKLQKIVDNLISNAIKYSDRDSSIRVVVSISKREAGKELSFVVEDQGVGIPQHEIEHVLKPFYRVDASREKSEGFGLGLAFVGELVRVWGGDLDIESPIEAGGKGTRITACLPLENATRFVGDGVKPEEIVLKDREDDGDEVLESARPRVLIVEDNADLRLFMREELLGQYDVIEAENGRLGLSIAIERNPDLVITDVMMPEMDGFELCRKLREESETSHIPIVILTAKSSENHKIEGAESGADVYFTKPLNMRRLRVQIENLLDVRLKMKRRFSKQLVVEPTELAIVPADQETLRKAIRVVEESMNDPEFSVDQFAKEMGMGRSSLLRKVKGLTGEAPGSFIRSMRLKRAAQLLESGDRSVAEVLEFVGIPDQSYFSRVFKKKFGVPPSQYGNRSS